MVINIKNTIFILTLLIIGTIWLCIELESDKGIKYQLSPQNATTSQLDTNKSLPQHNNATIEQAIINYSVDNNINYEISLRISICESQMCKYKENWSGSSAKGCFMFIDKTWANYCDGDVMNDFDNIRCFAKLYNQFPYFWECK